MTANATETLLGAIRQVIECANIADDEKSNILSRLDDRQTDAPELITAEEAAKIAKTSAQTIKRWIRAGKLHTFNKGRRHLISKAELLTIG